jgi:hypothetical protein
VHRRYKKDFDLMGELNADGGTNTRSLSNKSGRKPSYEMLSKVLVSPEKDDAEVSAIKQAAAAPSPAEML